ncbi:cellulose biosynthesis c-di-GMP-binding protein BcsE [Trabulsiella odontotermitis]|uniref:cellulose biosynthesis c-di-GMP-binding protein BcsE n=1 Tax=Trabulsiella odontotermitis TaxID=379893 RepID=UPI0024B67BEC|nr:cellulose biosynthesis c-di-GMP-binding protein BcsE [Trabulsiella odontotermitis]WHP33410.1 cellulose biosynthesis c-di-GMP-binding protein BcsE [Trabulsiella odontotermitis]
MRDTVEPIFSIGIQSLWDEVSQMPAGGVWWLNSDRYQDAVSLLNYTLAAQNKEASVAAVVMGENPKNVVKLNPDRGPEKIRLFSMPNDENGLYSLGRDLLCTIEPAHSLFILLCSDNALQNITPKKLRGWLAQMQKWVKYHHCTLLIINPGNNTDTQLSLLLSEYRSLSGLASVRFQGDNYLFDIAFWCNDKGVSARQQLPVIQDNNGWRVSQEVEAIVQPRSDEKDVLCNIAVLEGAPPLSEYWTLFDTNDAVFNAARTAQAATIIFTVAQNAQIEQLATYIHTLRRQRGSALKIIVRESTASLRATDERLLLGCGANIVVPWNAPLSRCLTLIESVQRQLFNRHVPEDIATLLSMTQPLKLRGFQKWDVFCEAVHNMMTNPLLPADGRGVMVALRPAPGLRVEQALTLCRPNRTGDIVTIGENRLVLFLSFCRINDLDTALNHIFPLPTGDVFSNRMVWFEDKQITSEIRQMQAVKPERWTTPLPITTGPETVMNVEHDGRSWRRNPEPIRLAESHGEHAS